MKRLFVLLFILLNISLFSQILELTSQNKVFVVQLSPTEKGVVAKVQGQWRLYNQDMQELVSFTLNVPENVYIYGCATDFDDDDNYEVFYWYYDDNYYYSTILKDLTTGENQLNKIGNSQYGYMPYAAPFYMDNQRYFSISKVSSSSYQVQESYLYRSGVEVQTDNNIVNSSSNNISNVSNFPNPITFDAKMPVNIEFELAKQQKVSLSIFNLKGQKVASILDNELLNAGYHSYGWIPQPGMSSGVYFYKIQSDNEKAIKKIIILK